MTNCKALLYNKFVSQLTKYQFRKTMNNYDKILTILKKEQYNFGASMRFIREQRGIKIREIANKVGMTATYISDIERGNNNPPGKKLMQKILMALEIQETELQNYLYDLAARERGGVSEDIADYIMSNDDLRRVIRMTQRQKMSEQFWRECLKRVQ